jgi:hypothetical protein
MTADPIYTLLQSAANAIAGSDNPPAWLVEGIPNIVYILKGNVETENVMPDREEWRKRFKDAANSARHLLKELRDYNANHGFLVMLMKTPSIYERLPYEQTSMIEGLESLATRCEEKLAELPTTHGGKKPTSTIDKTPSGKVLCALAVMLLWQRIHGKWPGVKNLVAQKACRDLWKAAGGNRNDSGNYSTSGWRYDLEKAKTFHDSWEAQTLLQGIEGAK